ncbi:hypothetical protein Fmac_027999 [Flemingia macrophylla]|uniref:Uncharacterized protein n=1 Tax=Flemingia macrophylla TaxID=520843 RepID=A0ABD1LJB7_9FABA
MFLQRTRFNETIVPHTIGINDSVAQWIRRWSTEPEILGSIPSGVGLLFN